MSGFYRVPRGVVDSGRLRGFEFRMVLDTAPSIIIHTRYYPDTRADALRQLVRLGGDWTTLWAVLSTAERELLFRARVYREIGGQRRLVRVPRTEVRDDDVVLTAAISPHRFADTPVVLFRAYNTREIGGQRRIVRVPHSQLLPSDVIIYKEHQKPPRAGPPPHAQASLK